METYRKLKFNPDAEFINNVLVDYGESKFFTYDNGFKVVGVMFLLEVFILFLIFLAIVF